MKLLYTPGETMDAISVWLPEKRVLMPGDTSSARSRRSLLGASGGVELRLEAFNVFNRANVGIPNRVVFSGASEGDPPLSTAGQITTMATDARQVQLGVKITF